MKKETGVNTGSLNMKVMHVNIFTEIWKRCDKLCYVAV
jgi:hypothetical protein